MHGEQGGDAGLEQRTPSRAAGTASSGIGADHPTPVNPRLLIPSRSPGSSTMPGTGCWLSTLSFVPAGRAGSRRKAAEHRAVCDPHRCGAYAGRTSLQRPRPYEDWLAEADDDFAPWAKLDEKHGGRASATPRAPRAAPRACSIRTARTCCMRWPAPRPISSACPRATR